MSDHLNIHVQIFHTQENVYDLLSACDVCVLAQPSTTVIEALAFGKPLVHLKDLLPEGGGDFFIQRRAAIPMTSEELAEHMGRKTDFSKLVSDSHVKKCLCDELMHTTSAVDLARQVAEKLVRANQSGNPSRISACSKADKCWSLILMLSESSRHLLAQLETLVRNSEGQGEYQVILVEPEAVPWQGKKILDSLQGDVVRVTVEKSMSLPDVMNRAAIQAAGKNLVFLYPNLAPFPQWLSCFTQAREIYGKHSILGARILDEQGSLLHGGMVVDDNHSPVSAYPHLEPEFAQP